MSNTMENTRELLMKIEEMIEEYSKAIITADQQWLARLEVLTAPFLNYFELHEALSKVLRSKER